MNYCPPSNELLDLIYLDDTLFVVNKPAGLLAVPGRGSDKQDCLASRTAKVLHDALVVHRLDMATSGLMMFALGTDMQRHLSRLFREGKVHKRYIAVVAGKPEPDNGIVNLPIAADWPNRPLQKIDSRSGKASLTCYRLLAYDKDTNSSRMELEPLTGRTHQLRVHMAAIGHPILGDNLYGETEGQFSNRLYLHASGLGFVHPVSNAKLSFIAEPPF